MLSESNGRVWKFGDDINTDLIFPNFAHFKPESEQHSYIFSANRPGWTDLVQEGDLLVVGRNFGIGSGRPVGKLFRALGIAGILCDSINGLALRNCINYGMPVLIHAQVTATFEEGHIAKVAWRSGKAMNLTTGVAVESYPLPPELLSIIEAGGVFPLLQKEGFILAES